MNDRAAALGRGVRLEAVTVAWMTIEAVLAIGAVDVRPSLISITAPTLVLHRSGDATVPIDMGRVIARGIPGARWIELPGADHLPWTGDVEGLVGQIEKFLVETTATASAFR